MLANVKKKETKTIYTITLLTWQFFMIYTSTETVTYKYLDCNSNSRYM